MATITNLPSELLDDILLKAVLVRGVRLGLRLRLVNKRWANDVKRVLFMSRLLDDTRCEEPTFLKAYFIYQIFSDQKNTIGPLRTIRRVAEILCEDIQHRETDTFRRYVDSLCSLTVEEGRPFQDDDWAQVTEYDKNFDYHLLVAAAYLNRLPLLRTLLPRVGFQLDGSPLFGHPAQAAALRSNNEALELILNTEWKVTSIYAFRGAIANANFDILNLLLEPRWEFDTGLNHRFANCIWQGLQRTSSVAMFTRAFPLLGDYEADPPGKRLGFFLRCAVTRGHTMLALHLFHLGAPASGHQALTFEAYNPLWAACKYGDETLVRLLLRKGANPNVPYDCPQSSPLQIASRRGRFKIVQALLEYGADVDKSSSDGPLPIVSAIELEHMAIFRLLSRQAALWTQRNSRIVFDRVARAGLESMATLLLQEGLIPTSDSVTTALEHGNDKLAQMLDEAQSDRRHAIIELWNVDWVHHMF
ncbi:ankyrin repeat-containing domain protein [Cadophora sp. MPI-SDFR-AT-0126]|nr:ankyrin repeat-containing domain protein [Leotiomycetes sp. MPI-SDFR-AT-0126]